MKIPTSLLAALVLGGLASGSGQLPTLKQAAQTRGVLIGGAVGSTLFDDLDPDYAATVGREFSVVVSENGMKWKALEGSPNEFVYGLADATVAWAAQHGVQVRGHTLIWHDSVPAWVYQLKTPAELRAAMQNHITQVMTHFGNRVLIWDVVNEAISDAPGHPLRANSPFALAGPDYIDAAFRWAHAANPAAKLYYNDYGAEALNGKSDAIYALVRGMQSRGVPISGVGFQAHLDANFSVKDSGMLENLKRFHDLGLDVQLTEVDVTLPAGGATPANLARQAQVYGDLMNACLGVKCSAFVMWGVNDAGSWRAGGKPLIFDDDYARKPAYGAVLGALQGH
ncbi:endo-1,4-beta-xylanase [Deinococcus sp. KSM4-11]|uniref:endo-1,4-beta-xylanase n=1 Tax=Deinococcus sp. KSM4-11 TaxID=2568654 RepID=UPI0010A596FE|nr:endo-1,4-beta-xylanase [Deinococcus sp. KSM4-11]THF86671.1 endo-1,4-beta-xylanase [Deinococcus sp. KSM4-11]